jgi:hypothetical protein
MKTLTKVKIGVSILICLLLLAAIARKTRENFQSEINSQKLTSGLKVYGNPNAKEVAPSELNQLGFKIIEEDDNILANLNTTKVNPNETRTCRISNKNDEERTLVIQQEANEAKRQLNLLVQQKIEETKNRVQDEPRRDPNPCSFLQFPAILS